jgi:hypothetical protein
MNSFVLRWSIRSVWEGDRVVSSDTVTVAVSVNGVQGDGGQIGPSVVNEQEGVLSGYVQNVNIGIPNRPYVALKAVFMPRPVNSRA